MGIGGKSGISAQYRLRANVASGVDWDMSLLCAVILHASAGAGLVTNLPRFGSRDTDVASKKSASWGRIE